MNFQREDTVKAESAVRQSFTYTLSDLALITGGRVVGGSGSTLVTGVCVVPTELEPGTLFIALSSSQEDIEKAWHSGAAVLVTNEYRGAIRGPALLVDNGLR